MGALNYQLIESNEEFTASHLHGLTQTLCSSSGLKLSSQYQTQLLKIKLKLQ